MKSIRNSLLVAWKDLRILSKDRGALIILFLLPLLIGVMYGSVFNPKPGKGSSESSLQFPISIVNLDNGSYSAQVTDILNKVTVLKIQPSDNVAAGEKLVKDGKVLSAVVIPSGFSQNIDAYQPSTIQVIVDPVQAKYGSIVTSILDQALTPVVVLGEVQYGIRSVIDESGVLKNADPQLRKAVEAQNLGAIMTQVQEMQSNPLVVVKDESFTAAKVTVPTNWFAIFLPAITVMFAFFIVSAMAPEFLKEKREGTMRRMLSSPAPRGVMIAGKMLAYLVIVFLQVVIIFGIGALVFNMPMGNSYLGLFLVTLAMGLAATTLGVLVAAISRSERQADAIGMTLGFLLGGLGGCIQVGLIPTYRMTGVIGFLSRLTPTAHALEAYRLLMLQGAGLVAILPQVLILLGFAVVFFVFALAKFKFE
jgi:ABC-2 type transport system permease protein